MYIIILLMIFSSISNEMKYSRYEFDWTNINLINGVFYNTGCLEKTQYQEKNQYHPQEPPW